MHSAPQPYDFLSALSQQRQRLLQRAGSVLLPAEAQDPDPQRESALSQCLVASLEALKVVEEELISQTGRMQTLQAESQRQLTHSLSLFDLAPAALLLTTARGVILQANQAAGALTTRDPYHLEGKPIDSMVARETRNEFRAQLARVAEVGGVTAWHFALDRQKKDVANVVASIQLIPIAQADAPALYWSLREL